MHIQLIDTSAIGCFQHRGQLACESPTGAPTQAVAGVLNYARQQAEKHPDVLTVWVGEGVAQWRHDMYEGYKTSTPQTQTPGYAWQEPWVQKALKLCSMLQVHHPGADASDVAWGLTTQLAKQGHLITLVTTDKIWQQSVAGRVRWQDPGSPRQLVELEGFLRNSGGYPSPQAVAQVQALAGDEYRGLAAVPGISFKQALGLIGKYKTAANLLAATEDFAEFSTEPPFAHVLMTAEPYALADRNRKLLDVSQAAPLEGSACVLTPGEWDDIEFYEMAVDLGLRHLQDEFRSWRRWGSRTVSQGPQQIVERALSSLCQSWQG